MNNTHNQTILAITPNPCVDVTVFGDGRSDAQSGGKGVNVARVLGNMGAPVLALTFTDATLTPLLEAEGIATVTLPRPVRIVTTYVGPSNGQRVDMRRGEPLTVREADALYNLFMERVDNASLVLLGGALPGPLERPVNDADLLYARIIRQCKQKRVPVWLDAHGPGVDAALCERPDYWKPNESEWTRLSGVAPAVENVRAWLQGKTTQEGINVSTNGERANNKMAILLTMGQKGAAYITADTVIEQPVFHVKTVNPVGSGDSFSAAFIWGLTRSWPIEECLHLACAAGAANAAMFPAARIGWNEIDAVTRHERKGGFL